MKFWNFIIMVVFTAVLITTGCKQKIKPGTVQIRYAFWSNESAELNVTKKLVREFEKKYPDIKVILDNIAPSDYYSILLTRMAGGTPPDVFYIQPEKFPAFVIKGVLYDMTELAESDKSFNPDIYYPQIYNAFMWDKKLYALPRDLATLVLFYNKDMFKREGLAYPDGTWDWNKFLEVAKKLTKDTDGDGKIDQYGYSLGFTEIFSWIYQNNGKIIENNKCVLDSPEAIEAIQFITDLRWKHKVASLPSDVADRGEYKMFMTGRVGMIVIGRWWVPTFRRIKEFDWDCAPLPRGKKRATALYGLGHAVSANTKYPEQAWEFIKYLSDIEGQTLTAELGIAIPSVKSVAESDCFLDPGKKPNNSRVFIDAIDYAYPLPWGPKWKEIEMEIQKELDKVLIGEIEVKDEVGPLCREVNKILEAK